MNIRILLHQHTRSLRVVLLLAICLLAAFVVYSRSNLSANHSRHEFDSSVLQANGTWPELDAGLVIEGLEQPVHLTHAGDGSGRVFVVEQEGTISIIKDNTVQSEPFLNIRDRVSCCGERGLLSVAFPPDYASKGYFYVDYTDTGGDTVIARYFLSENPDLADPTSEEVILNINQPFGNHNGGQLAFGPDGYLYIGMGDGGAAGDPQNNGQKTDVLLGKILRIDVESSADPYTIPPTNPYTQTADYAPEIWALGVRNPWRFSFDRDTGDMYMADVGQYEYEEVNFQPASSPGGENYGWVIMEGKHCYEAETCDMTGLVLPVAEYTHSQGCSVTGGFVYRGETYSQMQGVYFYADYCSGNIWGLRQVDGDWENELLSDTGYTITSFGEDEAGNLYLTDYSGAVVMLVDTADPQPTPSPSPSAGPVDPPCTDENDECMFLPVTRRG